MRLKKVARKEIADKLRSDRWDIHFERDRNREKINLLADRQKVLKKKEIELRRLIRELGFDIEGRQLS